MNFNANQNMGANGGQGVPAGYGHHQVMLNQAMPAAAFQAQQPQVPNHGMHMQHYGHQAYGHPVVHQHFSGIILPYGYAAPHHQAAFLGNPMVPGFQNYHQQPVGYQGHQAQPAYHLVQPQVQQPQPVHVQHAPGPQLNQFEIQREQALREFLAAQALLDQFVAQDGGNPRNQEQIQAAQAPVEAPAQPVQANDPQANQDDAARPELAPLASPIPVTMLECALFNNIFEVLTISFNKTIAKSQNWKSTVRRENPILHELVSKARKVDIEQLFPKGTELYNVGQTFQAPFTKTIPILTRIWFRRLFPRLRAYISRRNLSNPLLRPTNIAKIERFATELQTLNEEIDLFVRRISNWRRHMSEIGFEHEKTDGIMRPVVLRDVINNLGENEIAPRLRGRWVKMDGLLAEIQDGLAVCKDGLIRASHFEEVVEIDLFAADPEVWPAHEIIVAAAEHAEAHHHQVQEDIGLVDPEFGTAVIEMTEDDVNQVINSGDHFVEDVAEVDESDADDAEDVDLAETNNGSDGTSASLKRNIDDISN